MLCLSLKKTVSLPPTLKAYRHEQHLQKCSYLRIWVMGELALDHKVMSTERVSTATQGAPVLRWEQRHTPSLCASGGGGEEGHSWRRQSRESANLDCLLQTKTWKAASSKNLLKRKSMLQKVRRKNPRVELKKLPMLWVDMFKLFYGPVCKYLMPCLGLLVQCLNSEETCGSGLYCQLINREHGHIMKTVVTSGDKDSHISGGPCLLALNNGELSPMQSLLSDSPASRWAAGGSEITMVFSSKDGKGKECGAPGSQGLAGLFTQGNRKGQASSSASWVRLGAAA